MLFSLYTGVNTLAGHFLTLFTLFFGQLPLPALGRKTSNVCCCESSNLAQGRALVAAARRSQPLRLLVGAAVGSRLLDGAALGAALGDDVLRSGLDARVTAGCGDRDGTWLAEPVH
jgi:hypothetical protein